MEAAIVTGGTRGIGAAISLELSSAGFDVFCIYQKDMKKAQAFSEKNKVHALKCDVRDYEDCVKVFESITDNSNSISVLVNNAGVIRDSIFHRMTVEMWNDVINTNLTGTFNMTRAVWPTMKSLKYGRVINISSINGQTGRIGQANYSASKAGIIGMTRSLALEGARNGITVNAIAPGYIETEMLAAVPEEARENVRASIPVGRFGLPSDVAKLAGFLASKHSGFITGETIAVNGGQNLN